MAASTLAQFFCVLVVAAVCCCVIRPFSWRISSPVVNVTIHANYVTASIGGLLLLHFLDVMSLRFMIDSLLQTGRVQPWAVLVIFFTLAYASISLDVTGVSKYIALRFLGSPDHSKGGAQSRSTTATLAPSVALLRSVYVLSGILALLASNDVVVLTLTPVLIHYCRLIQVDPRPVLFAEYVSANTFSALLLVGNPTNIIVGQGATIAFMPYLMRMSLPTAVAVASSWLILGWVRFPPTAMAHDDDDDRHSETVTVEMGKEAPRCDAVQEPLPTSSAPSSSSTTSLQTAADGDSNTTAAAAGVADVNDDEDDDARLLENPRLAIRDGHGAVVGGVALSVGVVFLIICGYTPIPMYAVTSVTFGVMFVSDLCRQSTAAPTSSVEGREKAADAKEGGESDVVGWWASSRVKQVCDRMPWDVAPFASSMFILVSVLDDVGVTPLLTDMVVSGASQAERWFGADMAAMVVSSVGMVVVVVAMNLLNNQPATIFAVNILLGRDEALRRACPRAFGSLMNALLLGSNVAAAFSLRAALAGVMWESIIVQYRVKGLSWQYFTFTGLRWMCVPCVLGGLAAWVSTYIAD